MDRLTIYDSVAGCYKIAPESVGNTIQKLGSLEDLMQDILQNLKEYDYNISDADNVVDNIFGMLRDRGYEYED